MCPNAQLSFCRSLSIGKRSQGYICLSEEFREAVCSRERGFDYARKI